MCLFVRTLAVAEVSCCVDEPDVAERLRGGTKLAAGGAVVSSLSRPTSLRSCNSRSNSTVASSWRPTPAKASASQKVQAMKAPSWPGSPSTLP